MGVPICTFAPSLASVLDPTPNDCFMQFDDYLAAGLLAVIYVFARMILDRTLFQVRWASVCALGHRHARCSPPRSVDYQRGQSWTRPRVGCVRLLSTQHATSYRVHVEDPRVCDARGRWFVGNGG